MARHASRHAVHYGDFNCIAQILYDAEAWQGVLGYRDGMRQRRDQTAVERKKGE